MRETETQGEREGVRERRKGGRKTDRDVFDDNKPTFSEASVKKWRYRDITH